MNNLIRLLVLLAIWKHNPENHIRTNYNEKSQLNYGIIEWNGETRSARPDQLIEWLPWLSANGGEGTHPSTVELVPPPRAHDLKVQSLVKLTELLRLEA